MTLKEILCTTLFFGHVKKITHEKNHNNILVI